MRDIRPAATIIIFFFVVLFVYTKLAGPIPFSVNSINTTKTNMFYVDGVGEATAIPNEAVVSLGVTKNGATVQEVQQAVNTVTAKLLADLKKEGIEEKDIKTTNYSVYPNQNQVVEPMILRPQQATANYTATQNLEVHIKKVDNANKIMDVATNDGANLVGGITFALDEQTKKDLEGKARKIAITNAKEKATSIAKDAGISLGKIIDIQVTNGGGFMPYNRMDSMAATKDAAVATQLPTGENKVSITVTLSYETY